MTARFNQKLFYEEMKDVEEADDKRIEKVKSAVSVLNAIENKQSIPSGRRVGPIAPARVVGHEHLSQARCYRSLL